MKVKDLGIRILAKFYIFLIFLHILPLFVFATQLNICGKVLSATNTFIINILFIGLLWFLYVEIKNIKRAGFWVALVFHSLFTVNSTFVTIGLQPILMIEGVRPVTSIWLRPISFASIIINLGVIAYLLRRKQLFFYRKRSATD
ncbi:MAG: hypothetical protein JSW17_05080 [Candidatus Omnitrophota bacterium]|nr:MAG: hypothetical protein JSW17_05080 [Candidatus Omnitrophota bacterium]